MSGDQLLHRLFDFVVLKVQLVDFFSQYNVRISSRKLAEFRLLLLSLAEGGEAGDFRCPGDWLLLPDLPVIFKALLMVALNIGSQHHVSQSLVGIGPSKTHRIQLKSLDQQFCPFFCTTSQDK